MSVNQVHRAIGQWNLQLADGTPPGVIASLDYFGHVAIVPGRVNPVEHGDELLTTARYVGILRAIEAASTAGTQLSGVGMAAWLGDESGKGDVIEAPGVNLSTATFAQAIRALLPQHGAVTEGTIYPGIGGVISNPFMYVTPRTAIDYVCTAMSTDAAWRVNGAGTLDAGPAEALFNVTNPTAIIARSMVGYDATLRSVPGSLDVTLDAKEYSSRVVIVSSALAGGTADAPVIPYRDLHGNPVRITRVIDGSSDTLLATAASAAQTYLEQYDSPQRTIKLGTDEFDVAGDFEPGDSVWVYDPDTGVEDLTNPVQFRGRLIFPAKVSVISMTWPISRGYTIGYRDHAGNWLDLTPWVAWEDPTGGQIEVADSLVASLSSSAVGTQVAGSANLVTGGSVPNMPTLGTVTTAAYLANDGTTKTELIIPWTVPTTNTDGSTIINGDHVEIRYALTGTGNWTSVVGGWTSTQFTLGGLPPATVYDLQIRAVNTQGNTSAWSATDTVESEADVIPPPTPDAPTVAASLIAVQVQHDLGQASGGTFDLPLDLDHLDVHVGTSSGFVPSPSTLVGKLQANAAMLTGQIPALGTFPVASTAAIWVKVIAVDHAGNQSPPSGGATSTAQLIDDAHISSLTASKITAGSITAAVVIGGSATFSGALSAATGTFSGSLVAATGTFAGSLSAASGSFSGTITGSTVVGGTIETSMSGQRIVMDATNGGTIWFRDSSSDYAFINGPSSGIGVNSGNGGGSYRTRLFLTPSMGQFASVDASQNVVGGSVQVTQSSVGVGTTSGSAQLYTSNGSATVQGTSGINCTTSSGTALFGAGNNNYAQFDGATATVTGGGGSSYMTITSTTVNFTSTAFKAQAVWSATSGTAANVVIASTGQLYQHTSSLRYKVHVTDMPEIPADDVLAMRPIMYYDKTQVEERDGAIDGLRHYLGVIAEEVAEIPLVGDILVTRDDDGRPQAVEYARIPVLLLPIIKDLRERVAALESVA